MRKRTLIQYFEWFLPVDCRHWQRTGQDADNLARLGFSDVWLPPAYKGANGIMDVGYGVYDLYDLGEFYQKGSIPTKYGTKDDYIAAINALHSKGLRVIADIVLNHRMGADYCEDTYGSKMDRNHRLSTIIDRKNLRVWTGFSFPGRNGKYSSFEWTMEHFSSVDWNELTQMDAIFKLGGHRWSTQVDDEFDNYDYLMGADVDFSVPEVAEELTAWGKWYLDTTCIDGFRLDAVKHIDASFYHKWLDEMRKHSGKECFAVAEYWHSKVDPLVRYINPTSKQPAPAHLPPEKLMMLEEAFKASGDADVLEKMLELEQMLSQIPSMHAFDVPLHYRFTQASHSGSDFDLRTIFENTLLSRSPSQTVTFVDNHDTQPGQSLESWVQGWFKPLAYALILLRQEGTPCVFYGDLYGIPHDNIPPVPELETLLLARKEYDFGYQTDYFDHPNVIGWTHGSRLAVILSNGDNGWKDMTLGRPGDVFVDMLGNRPEEVVINDEGVGRFLVRSHSVSVWVPKK